MVDKGWAEPKSITGSVGLDLAAVDHDGRSGCPSCLDVGRHPVPVSLGYQWAHIGVARPSPVLIPRALWAMRATSSSPIEPTATATEIAIQRSPAEPKPAFTNASAARSRSASGRTTAWFFAPPNACTRLPAADAVAYTY